MSQQCVVNSRSWANILSDILLAEEGFVNFLHHFSTLDKLVHKKLYDPIGSISLALFVDLEAASKILPKNLNDLATIHSAILSGLQPIVVPLLESAEALSDPPNLNQSLSSIWDIFSRYLPSLNTHTTQMDVYEKAVEKLARIEGRSIAKFFDECISTVPALNYLQIEDILSRPIEYLPTLANLLSDLLEATPPDHPSVSTFRATQDELKSLGQVLDYSMQRACDRRVLVQFCSRMNRMDLVDGSFRRVIFTYKTPIEKFRISESLRSQLSLVFNHSRSTPPAIHLSAFGCELQKATSGQPTDILVCSDLLIFEVEKRFNKSNTKVEVIELKTCSYFRTDGGVCVCGDGAKKGFRFTMLPEHAQSFLDNLQRALTDLNR